MARWKKNTPLSVRLWSRVTISTDDNACWEWQGYRNNDGYGRLTKEGCRKGSNAHGVAYELTYGPPTPNKPYVLHTCDNPPCCNPNHLYAGTKADNNRDTVRRGRHVSYFATHKDEVAAFSLSRRKFSDEQRQAIQASTERHKVLALRYKVTVQAIRNARRRPSQR